jgi:hypothetical protein
MALKDIQWGFYIPKGQERKSILTLESWLSKAEWVKAYSFSFETDNVEQAKFEVKNENYQVPEGLPALSSTDQDSPVGHRLLRIILLVKDDFDLDLSLDLIKMWVESENDSDLKMLPETKPKNYD